MFDLILKNYNDHVIIYSYKIQITFDNYISFMNLLNNGSLEQKLRHSFKFFDVSNKGVILKKDFCIVILKLCEFFSKISMSARKLLLITSFSTNKRKRYSINLR